MTYKIDVIKLYNRKFFIKNKVFFISKLKVGTHKLYSILINNHKEL